jgi:hypothetical protein
MQDNPSPLGYTILKDGTAEPIYPIKPGYIATAAFITCVNCRTAISAMGGPRHNSLCLVCYDLHKLNNFIEGRDNIQ